MGGIEYAALIGGGLLAVVICWMDFQNRTVRLLPVLMLMAVGWCYRGWTFGAEMWLDFAINLGVVAGIAVVVAGLLRMLGLGRLVNRQIGIGDLLLMIAGGAWLNPLGFAFFLSVGLLLVLTGVLIGMLIGKYRADAPLPLAGGLAAFLLVYWPLFLQYETELRAALVE